MSNVEAISEDGTSKPDLNVPGDLQESELFSEFAQCEAASDEDEKNFSRQLDSEIEQCSAELAEKSRSSRLYARIVDETFGPPSSIGRKDLISLAEDEEFSGF